MHTIHTVNYNVVGKTYDLTRCADPEISSSLIKYIQPIATEKYLDVCCGSGNYTIALFEHGISISGVDISEEMLNQARAKNSTINWYLGDVGNLQFEHDVFDGITCINALHHLRNPHAVLTEIYRLLKPGGRLIIFTAATEQCLHSWLGHYFPFIWEAGRKILYTKKSIVDRVLSAGFTGVSLEKFFVNNQTKDLYLYTGKYRPEIYLDPIIRSGMTPFNLAEFAQETEVGCRQLENDIISGKINEIITQYESDEGEGLFIIAQK